MRQLYLSLVVIFVLSSRGGLHAQNMISNGGFETLSACPGTNTIISLASGWTSQVSGPASGSGVFSSCSTWPTATGVPSNSFGSQSAHGGSSYGSFSMPQCGTCNMSYAVNHFSAPLTAGVSYFFEMYISLCDQSIMAHNQIGAYFSASSTMGPGTGRLPYSPQLVFNTFVTDKSGWSYLSGTYTAMGGEQYVTIGSFAPYNTFDYLPVTGGNGYCLYYIDDVSLMNGCDMTPAILGPNKIFCADSTTITTLNAAHPNAFSYLWSTGSIQPSININKTGTYWVKYISVQCTLYDTITVTYKPIPKVELGNDTTLCNGQVLKLGKDVGPALYAWSGGLPGIYRTVTTSGTYSLFTSLNGCNSTDTVKVTFQGIPPVSLGTDVTLCTNSTATLSSTYPDSTHLWSTGSTTPTISVNTPGTYWLQVNNKGCKNRDTVKVQNTILKPFSIGRDTTLCTGASIQLRADSSNALIYKWSTNAPFPSIILNTPGTYWVDAIASPCTLRDSIVISNKPTPLPNLGADRKLCTNASAVLDAGTPGSVYLWDNNFTGQLRTISTAQQYWVKVTLNGCMTYDTLNLSPETPPVVELGKDTLLCNGLSIKLDAGYPGAAYAWQDGSSQPILPVTTAGKYKVVLTKGSCKVADSINVGFYPKPVLNLGKDTGSCFAVPFVLQSSTTAEKYLWQNGSTTSQYNAAGPGMYWLEITRSVCKVRDTVVLAQYVVPTVNLGLDKKICKEETVTLDAGNADASILWSDLSAEQIRTVSAPGTFSVKVTNALSCSAVDSITFDTFTSPVVALGDDSFVCAGQTFTVDAGNQFSSYLWQDGSTLAFYNATTSGTYIVAVKDANNCSATDSMLLSVKALPYVNWAAVKRTCEPDLILTPGTQYISYMWHDGSVDSVFQATEYGTYSVTFTDENNCSNTATTELINTCPGQLFVPNAFTPNGDGMNDFFIPVYKNVKSIHFTIYDRWGLKMFETEDMNKGWNGRNSSSTFSSDVYVYKVIYVGMDDHTLMQSGNVTLLK
jgi:gliding motility-associated-like protein